MERMLKPADVAAILQVSLPIARKHMLAMPGVLSVGSGIVSNHTTKRRKSTEKT